MAVSGDRAIILCSVQTPNPAGWTGTGCRRGGVCVLRGHRGGREPSEDPALWWEQGEGQLWRAVGLTPRSHSRWGAAPHPASPTGNDPRPGLRLSHSRACAPHTAGVRTPQSFGLTVAAGTHGVASSMERGLRGVCIRDSERHSLGALACSQRPDGPGVRFAHLRPLWLRAAAGTWYPGPWPPHSPPGTRGRVGANTDLLTMALAGVTPDRSRDPRVPRTTL